MAALPRDALNMRVLIKQNGSNLFFHLDDLAWTTRQRATKFASATDALTICLRRSLLNASLLIQSTLAEGEKDFVIAIE
jgi:hypothetical protein